MKEIHMRGSFEKAQIPRFLVLVMSLCLFSLADQASAQQQGGFIGQVKDESGGVLPGVTVTASSPALQVSEVSDVTNAQGEYRVTPLPIGTYTVTYTLPGFQSIRQQNLRLEIGILVKMDVVALKVGTVEETVTVSGVAPVVDVTSTASSTQFTRETLELTPTSRNGIISLGAQAPGVRGRVDIGGGTVGDPPEFKVFGQTWEAWITMEGMVTVDPKNSAMGGNYFDYGAIEEARVQSISNSPEVASHGVSITMLIKSGGNDFHGGGEYAFTSHRLESNNISAALKAQGITSGNPLTYRRDQSVDLGGRILRDKLWFYGAGRYRPQQWVTLGGFKPDGSPNQAYQAVINENEKFSAQLTPSNRFVFWGQWVQKYHYGEAVNEFVAWESRGDRRPPIRTNIWKAEWQATRGNSLVLSALVGRWNWTGGSNIASLVHSKAAEAAGIPEGLQIRMLQDEAHGGGRPSTFDIVTLKQAGQATSGGSYTDVGKNDAQATLSWFKPDLYAGTHEFKAGLDYSPYWYVSGQGDRGAAGQYRLQFNNGAPFQIDLYNYPVSPETDLSYTSAYVNDTWTIARRLTLDLGARYQRDNPVIPAQCRLAGAWPSSPAGCIEKVNFKVFSSIAPRAYFSYDVAGNAKTVLKGGWGRFDHSRGLDEPNLANPFLSATSTYRWSDLNGNRNYDPGEVDLDPNGPGFVSNAQPIGGVSNPNEKRPKTDQFSLTFEHELARNVAVRASGVYVRTFNEPRFLNTLRLPSDYNIPITNPDPGPDNRVGTADDPGTFITYYDYSAALAGQKNERFIITDDPQAGEKHTSVDLQLTKRMFRRWQFLVSYGATKNDYLLPRPADFSRAIPLYNPNVTINTANHAWEWVGKVSGVYVLPAEVNVSANFNYQSGNPQARQVLFSGGKQIPTIVLNAEPLGSIHLPDTSVVDLRLQKSFLLPGRQKVSMRVNFYNALNASTVTTRNLRSGSTYLRPTAITPPRIAELGVSYTF
jgi:hypothetical protein